MGLFDLFKRTRGQTEPQPVEAESPQVVQPEVQSAGPPAAELPATTEPAAPVAPVPAAAEPHSPATALPPAPPLADAPPQQRNKLRQALNRTRAFLTTAFTTDVDALVDEDFWDQLLDSLLMADLGGDAASDVVERVRQGMADRGLVRKADAAGVLRDVVAEILSDVQPLAPLAPGRLSVLLIVGVNGSGKTTLCAKLAHRLKAEGHSVLLAAADTFRAAATDQLGIWAKRTGVEVVSSHEGADPAAVVFDATQAAQARGTDVLIVDTAGRLQTKSNLMAELAKVARTVEKAAPGAQIAHILVLDATVGQNALSQAQLFNESAPLSGLALNKLDGTAKGGAIIAVVQRLRIPVLYLGVGEQLEDLLDFDAREFAAGLAPEL